jgi:hypothetical protein
MPRLSSSDRQLRCIQRYGGFPIWARSASQPLRFEDLPDVREPTNLHLGSGVALADALHTFADRQRSLVHDGTGRPDEWQGERRIVG